PPWGRSGSSSRSRAPSRAAARRCRRARRGCDAPSPCWHPGGSVSEQPARAPRETEAAPRVVLAGGGSAGHVNPLLATAAGLRAAGVEVTVLGTREGLEADLVPAAGFELRPIPKVPLPRRPSRALFTFPRRWQEAVAAATAAITEGAGAGAVVGFGGYVSTPAYVAARRSGVPVVIHEQNARP